MTRPGPHCGGQKRDGTGNTCTQTAGWGTNHPGTGRCKLHGGSTPSHRAAARIEQARTAAAQFGLPLDIDPADALAREVQRSAGVVEWLAAQIERVAGVDPDQLVRGTRSVSRTAGRAGDHAVDTTTTTVGPQVHAWWQLWAQERMYLLRVSAAAHAAALTKPEPQIHAPTLST